MNWNAETTPDGSVNWGILAQQVNSREDLIALIHTLLYHLREKPEEWENRELAPFLGAMAGWLEDMDGYYRNRGEAVPEQPTWKTLAQILLAARVYE